MGEAGERCPCALLIATTQTNLYALIVENYTDKRTMNVHATTVVIDEAQFSEPIHEKADPRTRGTDHLGEGLLADFRNDGYRLGFLAKICQQQEKPGEAFFARVEEVIHQIRFHANVP